MVLLCCAPAFLAAFDFGFMVLAGPRVGADLAAGDAYPWLFSAASFAYGAAVMPAATRLEPSRGLPLGLGIAAAGTALVALAGALPVAFAGRAAFGLGGGIAAPAALATLAALRRRAGFSALGAAVALGFASGALVAAATPWRAALAATAIATAAASAAAGRRGARRLVPAPRGAALFAAATLALACALAAPSGAILAMLAAALAFAGTRRAAPWLPERRAATAAVLLAAAATTASGVGATVVLGRSLAGDPAAAPVLAAFGIAALPAARLAGVLGPRCASAGLGVQALALTGVAISAHAAVVAVFGAGHVLANAGVAERATALAGEHVAPVAGLLVTAQYAGAGVGALLIAGIDAKHGAATAELVAAAIASAGAIVALTAGTPAAAHV